MDTVANIKPGSAQALKVSKLPVLTGFRTEILPVLGLLWVGIIVGFVVTGRDYLWPIGVWASVTITMLWPVGRTLGRSYFSYRRPAFVVSVLTMAYIPLAGFAIQSDWSFGAKSAVFFGLVADLTVFGIVASLPWAHAKPIKMFFRPDLLFGDGRILATGVLSIVFGIRYMMGPKPPDALWAMPAWEWYAILLAMLGGLIPLIAGRGMAKLLMRLQRVRYDAWHGWPGIVLKELWLIVTMLGIAFGFRHAFAGKAPFTIPVDTEASTFWAGILIMVLASAWLIVVRGGYKKLIGEPFITERVSETVIKELLLVVAVVPFFYAFMSMLQGEWLTFNSGYMLLIGLIGFLWGIAMLTVFRVIAQVYQRRGIVQHMAAVILPAQTPEVRSGVIARIIFALTDLDEHSVVEHLYAMNQGLAAAPSEDRAAVTQAMLETVSLLSETDRAVIVRSQARAIQRLSQDDRVTRMGDMMGAVSQLPEEQRKVMMKEMTALIG